MGTKKLPVEFRGTREELRVCWSPERVDETLGRWPEGALQLERIYEHESPSTLDQRSYIVERVLARRGITLQLKPNAGGRAAAVRDAFQALVARDAGGDVERVERVEHAEPAEPAAPEGTRAVHVAGIGRVFVPAPSLPAPSTSGEVPALQPSTLQPSTQPAAVNGGAGDGGQPT